MAGKKLNPEEAINELKEKFPQYDFSKSIYTTAKSKIIVTCKEHGDFEVIYNNMKSKNRGCPKCNGGIKYSNDDALNKLKKHFPNYDYSKFEYKGYNENCTLICENGHKVTKKYRSFSEGYGCELCKDTVTYKEKKEKKEYLSIDDNIEIIENEFKNIKVLEIPDNKHHKIKVECSEHGEFETSIKHMNISENPCPYCSGKRNFNPIETLKNANPEYDFSKFLYTTSRTKSIVICKEHGEFKENFLNTIKRNNKVYCPICYPISRPESLIREYIQKNYNFNIEKNRNLIKSKYNENWFLEIDMYIPELKIGFEFNGKYWHSDDFLDKRWSDLHKEAYKNAEGYHKYKYEEAKRNGIDLYFIEEEEFNQDKEKIFNKINDIITKKLQIK